MNQPDFVWDNEKAERNKRKHGIEFAEAATVFLDPLLLVMPDLEHSQYEDRWLALGKSRGQLLLVVVHTESEDKIRIISARKAEPKEARDYERRS